MQKIQDEFEKKGAEVVIINIDEEPYNVAPFLKKNPISATILLSDGQVERQYGVEGVPFNLVLDRNGMIRYRVRGSGKAVEDALRGIIESLLKEGEKKASSEPQAHYARARKYLALGERDKALEELKVAIQLAPEFVEAHRDFIDNQRDKAEALVQQYENYVRQNPNSAVFHYLLGKAYSNTGRRDQAEAEFKKALESDPEFSWTLLELGTILSERNERDKAVELWQKARKQASESLSLHWALGLNLLSAKRYELALEEVQRVLQLDPAYFDAYPIKWLAKMTLTAGSEKALAEVIGEIQELEAKHAQNIKALETVSKGYEIIADYESAAWARKAILALDPKYFERLQFPRIYTMTSSLNQVEFAGPQAQRFIDARSLKDAKEQLAVYEQLEKEIQDADVKFYLLYPAKLSSLLKLGDLENGERMLEVLEKGGMDSSRLADHRIELAQAYFDHKAKFESALDQLQKAVEPLRQRVAQLEQKESTQQAVSFFKERLASALHLRGQILIAKGLAEQALEPLTESVKLDEQEENTLDLGLAYSKAGKLDEGIELLAKAYVYEGKRKEEAKAALEQIYGEREKTKPLTALLNEAVERWRKQVNEATAVAKYPARGDKAEVEPKPAPEFELATLSGQKVRLSDFRGKVVVLNFWATW